MAQLEKLTADKIKLEFLQRSKEFCDYIFLTSLPKNIGGIRMNGERMLSALVLDSFIQFIRFKNYTCVVRY